MQEIFYTVSAFVVYVIAQSFIINGIKIASSGETETKPDGTERDSPMILYPIAKYINQHSVIKVFYEEEQLRKLIKEMMEDYAGMVPGLTIYSTSIQLHNPAAVDLMRGIAKKLKGKGILYEIHEQTFVFYKEYKEYRFSKWVRMPTFGCIRCMSSFWSIGTYWYPMIVLFDFHWWMVPLWFTNIAAVTLVNTYIAQRYTE